MLFGPRLGYLLAIDEYLINDRRGILSTPVISSEAGVIYACSWISPDGSADKAQHYCML
jgi:hypothetical protein